MSHETDAVLSHEFLYDDADFPSCHAATVAETDDGLLVAFFGGTHERHPDVCIYTSRRTGDGWTRPRLVADGVQPDGSRQPTWNPVLFRRNDGVLLLFYKVGPNPRQWWGMMKTSSDAGHSWSEPRRLPDGILGPIKNKPVQLFDGDILSPTSIESEQLGWRVYFERSSDGGHSWRKTDLVEQEPAIKAIQPSLLVHSPAELQAIGRTRNARLFSTRSRDAGRTWDKLRLLELPNCNSGTDAVTLSDGRHLLVYNHSATEKVRYPLNVALSSDGETWQAALVLEDEPPGQYSYPSVIQSRDGLVHMVYTWKRLRIRYARIDPTRLRPRPMPGGRWP